MEIRWIGEALLFVLKKLHGYVNDFVIIQILCTSLSGEAGYVPLSFMSNSENLKYNRYAESATPLLTNLLNS